MHTPPLLPAEIESGPPQTWWRKNLPWVILLAGLLVMAVTAGFGLLFSHFLIEWRRNSEPYVEAMRRVQCSPDVAEHLGSPITDGDFGLLLQYDALSDGSVHVVNKLRGTHAEGELWVSGTLKGDAASITFLDVKIPGTGVFKLTGPEYDKGGCPLTGNTSTGAEPVSRP